MPTKVQKICEHGKTYGHSHGTPEGKRSVLISMDGSEHAEFAFQWYVEHLHKPDHYVVLLHVPERHAFIFGPSRNSGMELLTISGTPDVQSFQALSGTADVESIHLMMQEEEEKEKAFLERLAQKLKDGGIVGKVKSVAGKPGEVIASVAEEEKAMFIVCGSRGKGTLRRTFLGSISDYILHHSRVPVFICRRKDLHKDHTTGSPSLKQKIMNSPLFRKRNKESHKHSPKQPPLIDRKEGSTDGD